MLVLRGGHQLPSSLTLKWATKTIKGDNRSRTRAAGTNFSEMKCFFGHGNVVCISMNLLRLAAPSTKKLRNHQTTFFPFFTFGEKDTIQSLKNTWISPDISDLTCGGPAQSLQRRLWLISMTCVTDKEGECSSQPIALWFHTATSTEKMLAAMHKEYPAVVYAVLLPRLYLQLCWFILATNHDALIWQQKSEYV